MAVPRRRQRPHGGIGRTSMRGRGVGGSFGRAPAFGGIPWWWGRQQVCQSQHCQVMLLRRRCQGGGGRQRQHAGRVVVAVAGGVDNATIWQGEQCEVLSLLWRMTPTTGGIFPCPPPPARWQLTQQCHHPLKPRTGTTTALRNAPIEMANTLYVT
jgi:hypothetical protein